MRGYSDGHCLCNHRPDFRQRSTGRSAEYNSYFTIACGRHLTLGHRARRTAVKARRACSFQSMTRDASCAIGPSIARHSAGSPITISFWQNYPIFYQTVDSCRCYVGQNIKFVREYIGVRHTSACHHRY